jgi:hydroxyacylglutathione hydrolase
MNSETRSLRPAWLISAILIPAFCLSQCATAPPAAPVAPVVKEPESAFTTMDIADKAWRIGESNNSRYMYLVAGEKQALLIDTGMGTGDLARFVTTLTPLPVIVVNTHGHPDHTGGNKYFDSFYIHPADMELAKYFSPGKNDFTPVKEGSVFDLGGRKLSVIETPGHTAGSICLLDAERKILFTGDNNCPHVWLFLPESLSVETYVRSQKKLVARQADFEILHSGHGGPFHKDYLEILTDLAGKILKGEGPNEMEYKGAGFTARSCAEKAALIAFDLAKLKDTK